MRYNAAIVVAHDDVKYVPVTSYPEPASGTVEVVAQGDESMYFNLPSISIVDQTIGVAWQAYYWEFVTGAIKYSQLVGGGKGWTNPTSWVAYYDAYYQKPTITGNPIYPNAVLAWQSESPLLYSVRGHQGSWSDVAELGAGADPTLSAGYFGNPTEFLLSREGSGPYSIQAQSVNMTEGDNLVPVSEGRGGRMVFRNGTLHVAVIDTSLDEQKLSFVAISDTTRINFSQMENVLTTEPFAGSGVLRLKTLFSAKGQLPQGARMRLALRDAVTGDIV